VKFSTGKAMTAADVKSRSTTRGAEEGLGVPRRGDQDVAAPDPSTVVFKLKFQWAPFVADIALFANAIIPKDFNGEAAGGVLQSTRSHGPFMWEKRVVGQSVTLKRNRLYWQKGKRTSIAYLDVRDRREHARAAVARRPDPDRRVSAVQLDRQAEEDSRRHDDAVFRPPDDYLDLNESYPPLADVHVRRAIS